MASFLLRMQQNNTILKCRRTIDGVTRRRLENTTKWISGLVN